MIWSVYRGAVTDRMCRKWFVKFWAGNFLLDDAPWLGRPVEVDRDQIETLIENNQCYTTWEITNILKISESIKLLVKMKSVSFILWKKLNRLVGQPNICTCGCPNYIVFHLMYRKFCLLNVV